MARNAIAVVSLPAKLPYQLYQGVRGLHCTVRFDVNVKWSHNIRVLLLTFCEIVEKIFSTCSDTRVHSFFHALSGKLSKSAEFVAQFSPPGYIFRHFVKDRFHIWDLTGLTKLSFIPIERELPRLGTEGYLQSY
jgi:hypothetical protein